MAWASARKGGTEAFAVSVDGGPVVQLTHWGSATTTVIGWLSAEEVVVVGPARSHSNERRRPWAYAVRLDGSSRLLPYGPLRALSTSADGAVLLGSVFPSEPAWWKRYRGGSGGKLWFDRTGSGEFERILEEVGSHLVDPMLVGDRIAFMSDHEGVGALYSTDRDYADLRRHTDLGEFYARHAATDGSRVVYQRAGELHLLGSLDVGAEPVRLEISLPGARVGREPFAVDTGQWLGEIALSQDGRAAAAGVRGTVHWLPVEQGPARTVLAEPGVRGRLPVVVPGGNAVRCVSDSGGEDGLELVPPDGEPARRLGQGRLGRVHDLAVVPDGKTAAVSSEDGRLLLVDLGETAEEPISELTRVEVDEPRQLVFSPDSGYLAWAQVWAAEGLDLRADMHVRLARLSDGAIVDVTGPRFHSHSPAFTHDGKYLALLSDQTYDPVYDGKLFDLGFPPGVRARAGEQIAAVDGRPVDPRRGPNPLLVGKAGRPVELTLRGANGDVSGRHGEVGRRVAVVPLGSEALLRDHDRISARRAQVRESSGGRLGYLHVPDLQSLGWAEFHRGSTAELARDGLALDLRENGGGHTSALVVEKLVRRVIGWVLARQGGVSPYPHDAPRGPIVTLIDEQAGSDGDIGPNAIRTYGVGPLVGVRTWGGVVGYDRDPQLETAIRLALESLQQHPAATPPALPTD